MTFRSISQLLCASFLFATMATAPATAAGTAVACSPAPTKTKAVVSDVFTVSTDSASYRNLTQTLVSFTQGGTAPGCVIVRFSAEAGASGMGTVDVRALLDDVTVSLPPDIVFGVNAGANVARSYDFIFPNVAPGAHSIRMQWKSGVGDSVSMRYRTTIVQYK